VRLDVLRLERWPPWGYNVATMATWTLKQAKDHLSAILDRVLAGEAQEIVRRGDPPVVIIAKSAIAPRKPRSVLAALTKYSDIKLEIPEDRKSRRSVPEL
jgi:prevent-host-death family protein